MSKVLIEKSGGRTGIDFICCVASQRRSAKIFAYTKDRYILVKTSKGFRGLQHSVFKACNCLIIMSKEKAEPDIVKAKLSKKIAELSTVVQALFTRNHEKELELMATKKSYEDEMKRVTEEGKSKLTWLEKQLDDLERFRTLLEMKTDECERTKATVETLQGKQLEAEKKMSERGVLLREALVEIENLKEEIASRSPEELQKLQREKRELSNELEDERTTLREHKEMVMDLQNKVHIIEMNLNGMLNENETLKNECLRLSDELTTATDDVTTLTQCLHDAKRHGERALQRTRKLEDRNKQVSAEKTLLAKCNDQLNEQVNKLLMKHQLRDKQIRPSSPTPRTVEITALQNSKPTRPIQKTDEILYLKREIEKYRLELKNREDNFNRVFAEKSPLIIKKPAEITAEELRLRNLTGLVGYRKNFTSLPSVGSESKATYRFHPNRTRR